MELLNIPVKDGVRQLFCEYNDGVYTFTEDIKNRAWTVAKMVKVGGPRTSRYKYDFDNYLEFLITDCHGESHLLKWYHNGGDTALIGYQHKYGTIECFPFFFERHPIFDCADWSDYENKKKILEIECIIKDNGLSNKEKLKRISGVFE